MHSLRIRLILLLGAAILAAEALQFATSFRAAMQEANKLFDYQMEQMAVTLQDSAFQQVEWYSISNITKNDFDFVIQIWTADGNRVYQSRPYRFLPPQGFLGYSTVTLDNGDWRVYVVQANTRVIQVSQKMEARRKRAASLAINALWPFVPVSLLLLAAAWWVVTSALAPLKRISHDLANRNAGSLAPLSTAGAPREVSLLVAELNSLLARMRQALQSQRRFMMDAAHELRSPITALKLQAQTLARAKDETARAQGISRLLGGVDRASRLTEQLLALAWQDPLSQAFEPALISLPACVEQAMADVAPFALSRQIQLKTGAMAQTNILGNADSLRIMIRNLLDNAVRYTPEQGHVRIDVEADASHITLTIQDSGAGIAQPYRARIFDRFYRVPGTSSSGTGLGLAIVKVIAERHKATLELTDAAIGGLGVKIIFPSMPDAQLPAESELL